MTKSELIARLAQRYPQLVAKDAEYAVKMILDAMTQACSAGNRIEIRGFGSFGLNYRPPRIGRNPEVGREGAGAGEVRAALQGRQGAARARRLGHRGAAPAAPHERASAAGPLRPHARNAARHAYRHLGDPPRRVPAAARLRGEEHRAGHAALLLRSRAAGAADRRCWSASSPPARCSACWRCSARVLRQRREIVRAEASAGAPAAPRAARARRRRSSDGVRILVAARLPAVLRPGLARRAHRHQAARVASRARCRARTSRASTSC